MPKLIQIEVVPVQSTGGPLAAAVGQQEIIYALDDAGKIWKLDPRAGRPGGWLEIEGPSKL